ncbi:hypothetical protein B0H14DRAFT_2586810 [Mycena olivaceomarginata]|nr:hypothetical protein B0H14DRAFT_2586810 [Mycena olivaceomarginata]
MNNQHADQKPGAGPQYNSFIVIELRCDTCASTSGWRGTEILKKIFRKFPGHLTVLTKATGGIVTVTRRVLGNATDPSVTVTVASVQIWVLTLEFCELKYPSSILLASKHIVRFPTHSAADRTRARNDSKQGNTFDASFFPESEHWKVFLEDVLAEICRTM